ncbi:MAG: hypothetical protein ACKO8I_19780 [Cyanobacteriota bacterium]
MWPPPGLLAQLEALLQRFVDLMRLRERMPPPAPGDPAGGCQRVSGN